MIINWKLHSRENLKLAFPVMLSQLGQIILNVADTAMVGKVANNIQSEINLGAASLANMVFILFFVIALGVSVISSPLIAEKAAQQDHKGIQKIFLNSLFLNILLGLIMISIGLLLTPLFYQFEQPKIVIDEAIPYFNWMILSLFPLMLLQGLKQLGEGLNVVKITTWAIWLVLPVNIFLNYCWIEGHLGFEALGVKGAALGTFIARILAVIILYYFNIKHPKIKPYLAELQLKLLSRKILLKLLRLGIPTSLQMFFEVSAFTIAAFMAGYYTNLHHSADLAAHQVSLQLASISFMICIGFSVASTVRVAHGFGKKHKQLYREAGFSVIAMAILIMCFFGLIFIFFRHQLPVLFTDSPDAVILASDLLIITALFQLGDGIQLVSIGALRGMQDVNVPMCITFVAYWLIALPLAYILGLYYQMGAFGIWIGLGTGLTFSAIVLLWRFHRKTLS